MFRLVTGRHLRGAGGENSEAALQGRVAKLQAELAEYKVLADRRARLITALSVSIVALVLAFGLALTITAPPVQRAVFELVQGLTGAHPVSKIDAGEEAYRKGRYAAALRLVQPLAEEGDSKAQYLLGLMYYHGRGLKQDDLQAAKWFRLAADQGEAGAQFNLGVMYAEGQGVPQDYAEAIKWYRRAADQGDPRAQFNLGVSYAEGQSVEKDYVTAYMWFNLAAAHFASSDADRRRAAITNRDIIASRMPPEDIAEAQRRAHEWKPVSAQHRSEVQP